MTTAVSKRRWLRFSLRTMFVLVTAVALWLGWELSMVRARRAALVELRNDPAVQVFTAAEFESPLEPPDGAAALSQLRILLGDRSVAVIRFDPGHQQAEVDRAHELFPEADVGTREAGIPFDPVN